MGVATFAEPVVSQSVWVARVDVGAALVLVALFPRAEDTQVPKSEALTPVTHVLAFLLFEQGV